MRDGLGRKGREDLLWHAFKKLGEVEKERSGAGMRLECVLEERGGRAYSGWAGRCGFGGTRHVLLVVGT